MPESPDQEWRRLTQLYADKYGGELLELAASFEGLTEMAKTVLRDEMRKRGLGDPIAPGWASRLKAQEDAQHALDAAEAEAVEKPVEYTWKTILCERESREEAWQTMKMLGRAGIESWLRDPSRYFVEPHLDLTNYCVLVAADQLDEARAVIANPIPQDIIDESREEIPEYTPPVCPACGAADPILLSAEPSNSWECESCGEEWTESLDDRAEAS